MPFCPMCRAAVVLTHRFCADCGAQLPARKPTPAPLPELPPVPSPASESRASEPAVAPPTDRHARDTASVPVRDLLGSGAPPETGGRRRLFVGAGIILLMVASGIVGYAVFRQAPKSKADVQSVEQTEQLLDAQPPRASVDVTLWTVVDGETRQTTNADAMMGKPDSRTATIARGGAVALAYAGKGFYNGEGPDIRVDGPAATPAAYTIFARGGPQEAWRRFDVNRAGFRNGFAVHDFGHHQLEEATQILIRNDGSATLSIDAVTPLHLDAPASHGTTAGKGDAHEKPDDG